MLNVLFLIMHSIHNCTVHLYLANVTCIMSKILQIMSGIQVMLYGIQEYNRNSDFGYLLLPLNPGHGLS